MPAFLRLALGEKTRAMKGVFLVARSLVAFSRLGSAPRGYFEKTTLSPVMKNNPLLSKLPAV